MFCLNVTKKIEFILHLAAKTISTMPDNIIDFLPEAMSLVIITNRFYYFQ